MFKKITLQNGLRMVINPLKNTAAVTILLLVATGSKYETKNINGISHLLEHTIFKGTKKRPTTLAIAEELDRVGGVYNAFTGKEIMGFWVKVDGRHFRLATDVLSDLLFNSLFKLEEIEKEKRVIFEEINMLEDDPQRDVWDLWEKLLYGDQPAGRSITGEKETVAKISRENLVNYLKNNFVGKNTVISLAGHLDGGRATKEIEKFFGKLRKTKTPVKMATGEKQVSPGALLKFKETEQTHLCLGVRAVNLFNPDRYVLGVIAGILGGSMSSRLPVEVRQKRGLAYYVATTVECYTDTGYLVTSAGIDNQRVFEAIKVILEEYKNLKTNWVHQRELDKVKENIKGRLILGIETSDAWAAYLGEQETLKKKILTLKEECDRIDAVTQTDILRLANIIFRPEKLNLTLIGPFKNETKFQPLLRI